MRPEGRHKPRVVPLHRDRHGKGDYALTVANGVLCEAGGAAAEAKDEVGQRDAALAGAVVVEHGVDNVGVHLKIRKTKVDYNIIVTTRKSFRNVIFKNRLWICSSLEICRVPSPQIGWRQDEAAVLWENVEGARKLVLCAEAVGAETDRVHVEAGAAVAAVTEHHDVLEMQLEGAGKRTPAENGCN